MDSLLNRISDAYHYDPDKHIPDLSSKVIIVTGGNAGIGKQSVLELSKHNPKRLYMAARSKAKYETAMADIRKAVPTANVEFLELDLASFASIKRAADTFLASNDCLDILLNNAGIMGAPATLTADGYEAHFGTNHMGHALLTKLLTPILLKTAEQPDTDVRVVTVSSAAIMAAPRAGFLPDKVTTTMGDTHSLTRYGQSKLANVLFAKEFAKRYPTITSVAIHPGRVQSQLLDDYMQKWTVMGSYQKFYDRLVGVLSVEQGAWSQLWAATWPDKEKVVNGGYFIPVGKEDAGTKQTQDPAMASKLWDWQEEQFKTHGYA